MSSALSRIKIGARIFLINGVIILGMSLVVGLSMKFIEDSLNKQLGEQTRRLVESATTLIDEYQKRHEKGEISLEQAQKEAMRAIQGIRYDKTNYFWINDFDGTMLMHPVSAKLVGTDVKKLKDAKGTQFFVDMINVVKEKGAGLYTYYWPPDESAKPKISYVQGYPKWKWVIGSGVFVDEIEKQVWQVEKMLIAVSLILIFLALLVSTLIGKSISRPVLSLTKSMKDLANGRLDAEIGMQDRGDEIGDMAKTVGVFQDNARQVEKLKREQLESEERTKAEKKAVMAKLAEDFEKAIGNIVEVVASSALELQSSAKNMSEISDQTSRQTANVASATEEASASVQTVASAAEELSASISEINRQIETSQKVANDAVDEVKRTDQTVSTLSEAATQIGDVVKLIQDIAEQTNLLALNATIEAARAGEAGKGFAVVASEVKGLANQTAKATEEISKKIVTVQSVSGASVSAIRRIGGTIERIDTITRTIADALRQQDSATREISNNVQQASAGTNEVSSSIVNVTHAAQESRNAANDVMKAANDLSEQSKRLRLEIGNFLSKVREG